MRRILICDDEEQVADELTEFFTLCGWQAVPSYSSREARRLLMQSVEFDCLLTDNAMPGGNGLALVTFASTLPPPQRPAILCLMTGIIADRTACPSDILHVGKPFDAHELHKDLTEMLRQS